ncbi:MAG TPA: IS66 family transposase [Burkholderiales bacterium]|nr:IS66 family transposase [Burkholderiales bacterium]
MDLRRETDIEQLRRIALVQQTQIEQLIKVLSQKCRELSVLKGSEQELQQTLSLIEQLTTQAQAAKDKTTSSSPAGARAARKPRTQFGPSAQPLLQVDEKVFELDEPDRTCPSCGGRLEPMADQFETSEMVDVVEVSYRLVKVKQQKYVCGCGGCVETAPGPERATAGSRYSLDFAIKVAIDKYLDHLPLARQERILKRHDVQVTSQTLWDLTHALGTQLARTHQALYEQALSEPVIGLDQTGWKRLDDKDGKPWQMWCITTPKVVYHRICDDKSAATFVDLVGDYEGAIVCDALKTHEAGAREGPGIVLAGCWAHVFRKFEEAEPDHPEAQVAMRLIGQLYEIDEKAGDDLVRKGELRRTESVTVLDQLKSWLWSQAVLKTLTIGKAAAYTIANWERLTRFVDDPRIPLDNNATERGIRGPVVGRRNHFGSKSRCGTEVASISYSLIETAKLNGADPARYLAQAVRAARMGEVLLPWQMTR